MALVAALVKKINAERREGDKVTATQVIAINKMAAQLGVDTPETQDARVDAASTRMEDADH